MENRSSKTCINIRNSVEQLHKMGHTAGTAAGNDRNIHHITDRLQHLQIKACLDAVCVNGIDYHLTGTQCNTLLDPFDGIQTRIFSATLGKTRNWPSTRLISTDSTTHWLPYFWAAS